MSSKILNREIVKKAVTTPFWKSDRNELFADDFHIEMPNAAPGVPQVMDPFEVRCYFRWLDATVKTWDVELEQLYGTPDPNVFWAISFVHADVHWGGRDGRFETKRFGRYELKEGKIVLLAELTNPLKWLEAAGREIPVFRMDLMDERVTKAIEEQGELPQNTASDLPVDPDSVSARIAGNVSAFMRPGYWEAITNQAAYMPGFESKVWFLPPEMNEAYPPEMMQRVETWSVLSCPEIDFDRNGRVWETDDPHIFFGEYRCSGITDWIGNNAPGSRYRNRYFYVLHFNDAGQITCCEEILNPINKYNSINVSIPTFPYYY